MEPGEELLPSIPVAPVSVPEVDPPHESDATGDVSTGGAALVEEAGSGTLEEAPLSEPTELEDPEELELHERDQQSNSEKKVG